MIPETSWLNIDEWINSYPEPERVMIDAGSESGLYVFPAARRFRHVYAIDAHPGSVNHLRSSTGHLGNVTCINKVIDFPGPMSGWPIPEEVERTTFDRIWQEIKEKGETIGLIKCDIEGAEDTAWEHAVTLLDDNKDWLWIVLELHQTVNMERLHRLFTSRGYVWSSDNLHHAGHYLIRSKAAS